MSDPMELEVQVIVNHQTWKLGTQLQSSGKQQILSTFGSFQPQMVNRYRGVQLKE